LLLSLHTPFVRASSSHSLARRSGAAIGCPKMHSKLLTRKPCKSDAGAGGRSPPEQSYARASFAVLKDAADILRGHQIVTPCIVRAIIADALGLRERVGRAGRPASDSLRAVPGRNGLDSATTVAQRSTSVRMPQS